MRVLIYVHILGILACYCRSPTALLAMIGMNVGNVKVLCASSPTTLGVWWGGVGNVPVFNKKKHIFPHSHVSHGVMNVSECLQPLPTSQMICLTGEFWRTCWLGWACPFWDFLRSQPSHVILAFWLVLQDVVTTYQAHFCRGSSTSGEDEVWDF